MLCSVRAIWAGLHKYAFELELACVQVAECTLRGNLCMTAANHVDTVHYHQAKGYVLSPKDFQFQMHALHFM